MKFKVKKLNKNSEELNLNNNFNDILNNIEIKMLTVKIMNKLESMEYISENFEDYYNYCKAVAEEYVKKRDKNDK